MRVRSLCSGDNLFFADTEPAERDILANRAVEQLHILPDIADLVAQRAA